MATLPAAEASDGGTASARRQLAWELVSGLSGLGLTLFMWGHMLLVGSILTGTRGFDTLAQWLEDWFIAQPTVVAILVLFLVHAAFASRKIPARLQDRRRLARLTRDLDAPDASGGPAHRESLLWLWQFRTGMIVLVLGSFHILLLGLDVLTPLFGQHAGIESLTSMARVRAGLWLPYAILLICVEFHASIGLYRLAVKWGVGSRLSRATARRVEKFLLWFFLGLGALVLLVLAGLVPPPFGFLTATS
jgi:succinate dehydrogenase subunit C